MSPDWWGKPVVWKRKMRCQVCKRLIADHAWPREMCYANLRRSWPK